MDELLNEVDTARRPVVERASSAEAHAAATSIIHLDFEASAKQVLSERQKWIGAFLLFTLIFFTAYSPGGLWTIITLSCSFLFLGNAITRVVLMFLSRAVEPPAGYTSYGNEREPETLSLPKITILAPLFREGSSVDLLRRAIDKINYPDGLVEVIALLEEGDNETLAAAKNLKSPKVWRLLIAPPVGPRTKPKACNLGLARATGDLVVIYDAEDLPAPDQLKMAAAAFANADARLACVQAQLNFYNANENLLTRLFALEYALWFDFLLPALQKLGAPIPLGGTSNFFRVDILKSVGGWDAHNVTEDADLGLRLARKGFRTEIIPSSTYEEANSRMPNWLRQRSRWIKGHMQTWLTHSRNARDYLRATGWAGVVSLHLFLFGAVASALAAPILLFGFGGTVASLIAGDFKPTWMDILQWGAFLLGNALMITLGVVAPSRRGWGRLSRYAVLLPFYWLATSFAAFIAIWQLVRRPYFWEKTDHMLSPQARDARLAFLRR